METTISKSDLERTERLRTFFDSLNMSQQEFANSISRGKTVVSLALSGKRKIGLSFMRAVCRAYPQVTLQWFNKGTGASPLDAKKPYSPSVKSTEGMVSEYTIPESLPHSAIIRSDMPTEDVLEECRRTLEEMRGMIQQVTVMASSASLIMQNAVQLNKVIQEDHRLQQKLYNDMHSIQQEHIHKSQNWINEQKKSMENMRESLVGIKDFVEQKIDEQTEETERNMNAQFAIIRKECRTAEFPSNCSGS